MPFLYDDGSVAGHITMGSNMDTYNFYGISEEPGTYNKARNLSNQNAEIVFVPFNDSKDDFLVKRDSRYDTSDNTQVTFTPKSEMVAELETSEKQVLMQRQSMSIQAAKQAVETLDYISETKEELDRMPESFGTLEGVYDRMYTPEAVSDNRTENQKIMNAVFGSDESMMKER